MIHRLIAALIVLAALCVGQKVQKPEPVKAPASPTGLSIGQPFYSVDDATHLKIRDLEFKANQLEIGIQQMKVKIEEDKAAETALWKEIQSAASSYAKDKAIDADRYDFDAGEIKFVQKKKP